MCCPAASTLSSGRAVWAELLKLAPPHSGHLVAQAPDLERVEQGAELRRGGAHFLLVIAILVRPVIGNGVAVLAHVGQHPEKAFAVGGGGCGERTLQGGQQQREKQAAVLFDVAVSETAAPQPDQLALEIRRQPALGQRAAHPLHVMRRDQVQKPWPRDCYLRPRPDLANGVILQDAAPQAFHTHATLTQEQAVEGYKVAPGLSSPINVSCLTCPCVDVDDTEPIADIVGDQ